MSDEKLSDMHVIEEGDWPEGAVADGEQYSLEVSRAMRLDEDAAAAGTPIDECWVPNDPALAEPPEFERMTGTYADVQRRAHQINAQQHRGGFSAWVFYPSPIPALGAR